MNEINDLYDIIDAMRKKYHMSSRTLAIRAGIPVTTLASMMSRRPATIDKSVLEKLASVFHVEWFRLLNLTDAKADEYADELRIPTKMEKEDVDHVYRRIVKTLDCTERFHEIGKYPSPNSGFVYQRSMREKEHEFQQSIMFVLEKLNDDGLMEAMRRILDVANDPKYCKPKKEDDSWQKEKPPMGAEQSESGVTDDIRATTPLDTTPEQGS